MQLIDGKGVARKVERKIAAQIKRQQLKPKLAIVLVGEDPASQVYVRLKNKSAERIGVQVADYRLPAATKEDELLYLIDQLNKDTGINGILVQLPLPKHFNEQKIIAAVRPEKDVDGFHPVNMGKLLLGQKGFVSCTPAGVLALLDYYKIPLATKHAVIIGRSITVGKPLALLLLQRDATVTICHSRTKNLAGHTRQADILVSAVGKPGLVKAGMVKKGATVIDVGTTKIKGELKGDADFGSVKKKAAYLTPVPGGVGPMTVAMLMQNTLQACKLQAKSK